MKRKLFLAIPLILLLAGCSTVPKRVNALETKVNTLEAQVNSVEQKQAAIEGQTSESRESVAYLKGRVDARGPSTVVVEGAQGNGGYVYKSGKKVLTHNDIQLALKNAGFYNGPVDGKIGRETKRAIRKFQKANRLKATGRVNAETESLLLQYLPAKAE